MKSLEGMRSFILECGRLYFEQKYYIIMYVKIVDFDLFNQLSFN